QIYKRKKVTAFIIDETIIQIGNQHYWVLFCIEPVHSSVLGIYISEERNIFGYGFVLNQLTLQCLESNLRR
ncbi:MAG: hypothetical protein R3321_10165, partial [Nitrososphaeraceae archaeon]|nr:hypothetical protein [Nitrososphaeraceae archaeon]